MSGRTCCISVNNVYSSLLSCIDFYINKLKYQIKNDHNRRSGEFSSRIYDNHKNSTMTHGRHMYKTAVYMSIATICDLLSDKHALSHWKFVLRCCSKCSIIFTLNH